MQYVALLMIIFDNNSTIPVYIAML
jgi:hypothetical protein